MKLLIIPDIHTFYSEAEEVVNRQEADKVIFLGDYFDQFNDSPEVNCRTAVWLKKGLENENHTYLLGNHDIHYLNMVYQCSGFDFDKFDAIRSVMRAEDFQKLKLYAIHDNVVFTHAGIHKDLFPELDTKKLSNFLINLSIEVKMAIALNSGHVAINAGRSRGGAQSHGGLTWCDFTELQELPGWVQVVGHTVSRNVQHKQHPDGLSICLDTTLPHIGMQHYAIIEKRVMTVYKITGEAVEKFDLVKKKRV